MFFSDQTFNLNQLRFCMWYIHILQWPCSICPRHASIQSSNTNQVCRSNGIIRHLTQDFPKKYTWFVFCCVLPWFGINWFTHILWAYFIATTAIIPLFQWQWSNPDKFITWIALEVIIWGVLCQKQASRAGTSKYIPQILWDVITLSLPLMPASDTTHLI